MQVDVEFLVPYNQIAQTSHLKIDTPGDTLADLIGALVDRIPALAEHLTGEEIPGVLPFLLMINGKIIRGGEPGKIRIASGDRVTFTRILAGG